MTLPSKWPQWKVCFLGLRMATELMKHEQELEIASLVYSMEPEAEHIVKNSPLAECETFDKLTKQFDNDFIPKKKCHILMVSQLIHSRVSELM